MSELDADRPRINALLRIENDPDVRVTAPAIDPGTVGAEAGVGFRWPDSSAVATVLLFSDYDPASAALQSLRAGAADDVEVRSTVNGSLLLWATADKSEPAAVDRIAPLDSWFAGEE